jgi:hypothetical protein
MSNHVAQWMVSYVDHVIVCGHKLEDAVRNLLYSSGVGKHTSIVHIDNTGRVTRYIWDHDFQRPNASSFPITCPVCNRLYPWGKIQSYRREDGAPFKMMCQGKGKDGRKCCGTWQVPERPSSSVVNSPYVGTWRQV